LKSQPVRTCLGCRQREAKSLLVRFSLVGGEWIVCKYPFKGAVARGGYIHPNMDCLKKGTTVGQVKRAVKLVVSSEKCKQLFELVSKVIVTEK
jgi:predicted RNA-binding protein YlxR (DUF448 family)